MLSAFAPKLPPSTNKLVGLLLTLSVGSGKAAMLSLTGLPTHSAWAKLFGKPCKTCLANFANSLLVKPGMAFCS